MAKDIFQAKKRVSHFQRPVKGFEGENELLGCNDYVSSIIQGMDSNFSNIQSNYSKRGLECNETYFTCPEDSFLNIPLLKIPSPSSSNGTVHIPAKHMKTKKFTLSRKFPLMEKSQKFLKQLKHNQNIPKPRAHLAGIPKSPVKSRTKYVSPIKAKKKEILNAKNKISNPHCKVPSNHSSVSKIKNSDLNENSEDNLVTKHNKPKNSDSFSGKDSYRDISTVIDSNKETNSVNKSDSSSSDSEYERFVKKSKKGLQKKSSKVQKKKTKKSKSCTKSLKRKKLTHVSEQKNISDCDNVTEVSKYFKISPCKKQSVQDNSYFENDLNCSDHDVPTRDSSPESDDSVDVSETQQMISKTCEIKPVGETGILLRENSSQSCPSLNILESNINSDLACSNDETQTINSVRLEIKQTGKSQISCGPNFNQSSRNVHVLESNINSDKMPSECLNKNISSIKIEHNNLPPNIIIDISDSDDECNNGETNASGLSSENGLSTSINPQIAQTKSLISMSDSEESDIEIIEEVEKSSNAPVCSKDAISSETPLDVKNEYVDVKPLIKTEVLESKSSVNILPVVKSQNEAEIGDKHNTVYRTDICYSKMTVKKTIFSNCSKNQTVPSNRSFKANPDLAVVKQEIDSDDDILILDSVISDRVVDASNLPSAKTKNIKSEPSTSDNNQKLFGIINSDPKIGEIYDWEKDLKDVIPVKSTELLNMYKMEFEAYMEMKQANADYEASLKNIQARQAQKMMYVRNLFIKWLQSSQITKPLAGSVPLPLIDEPLKDSKNCTFISVPSDCDITPNNSFSLNSQIGSPSTVVQDIKPTVPEVKEEVQSLDPKKESIPDDLDSGKLIPKTESDDKQTLKLLNEKCSVCGKDAVAACQRCAKVFFCSHSCGRKFWVDGHVNICGTK